MKFTKVTILLSIMMSLFTLSKIDKRSELSKKAPTPTGYNSMGYWWVNEDNRKDVIVVLGGDLQKVKLFLPKIINKGYNVWVRAKRCISPHHHRCTEAFGYYTYLQDPDPAKPTAEWVVFLHGHTWSWHTSEIPVQTYLHRSVECAQRRGIFTPVANTYNPGWFGRPEEHWKIEENIMNSLPASLNYPRLVESYKGSPTGWTAWCCGEFIVPKRVLDRRTFADYRLIQNLSMAGHMLEHTNGLDGFFFEFSFHLLFDMPARPDPTLKECRDLNIPVYADLTEHRMEHGDEDFK
eukprot:TRINITY_DN7858_c0_g1_i1.p1 TRINITY_DN7858_c0_g1~~TRINITY_DN7858_c0_g1_i1.p1  ORF type:complete len:305 (+),score=57.35 TRINITY_DN7858_c0_g1_i1:37-915(+)